VCALANTLSQTLNGISSSSVQLQRSFIIYMLPAAARGERERERKESDSIMLFFPYQDVALCSQRIHFPSPFSHLFFKNNNSYFSN
jgi:hypothetical protein